MNSSKRILDQLEQRRTVARPLSTRSGRKHLVYAGAVAAAVTVLSAGVVAWGTDARPQAAAVRDPVFKLAQKTPAKSVQEEQQLAAAIVNEPLQHHVAAQAKTSGASGSRAEAAAPARPRQTKAAGASRAASAQAVAQRPATGQDSDVALLAALVAHANGPAATAARDPGSPGLPAAAAADIDRGATATAAADALSTQLKQCSRLGAAEAAQCHARACTGRWGRDHACRITTAE